MVPEHKTASISFSFGLKQFIVCDISTFFLLLLVLLALLVHLMIYNENLFKLSLNFFLPTAAAKKAVQSVFEYLGWSPFLGNSFGASCVVRRKTRNIGFVVQSY